MAYRKKLIEVALPLEAINEGSKTETDNPFLRGHPRAIHNWWARTPLTVCRVVVFAQLVDDPNDPDAPPEFVAACRKLPRGKNAAENDTPRQRLFDFIERLGTWKATTDEKTLDKARELIWLATGGNLPPFLDPFAGRGSIPLEAQRLGLKVYASDLNPVAVMINKALIEIPPKFADMPPVNPQDRESTAKGASWKGAAGLAADVRYYGEWMRDRAWERIGHLYPDCNGETVFAWLWARTVICPNPACGAQMPLVSTFWLSKKKGRHAWVEPKVDRQAKTVHFSVRTGKGTPPSPPKVSRGAHFRCLVCGEIAPDQHLKDEGMAGRMGAQLMAVVTDGKSGRSYYAPTPEHEQIAATAQPEWAPRGELPGNTRWFSPPLFGMTDYADLFTPRQLVALTTFSDLVAEARHQIVESIHKAGASIDAESYANAVAVYLACSLSRLTDYSNTLCTWNPTNENIGHLFQRQAIPMAWDFAEANNLQGKLTLHVSSGWVAGSLSSVPSRPTPLQISQQDAQRSAFAGQYSSLISTDPPYYDYIGYADLSDFFYVWLRRSLQSLEPNLFATLLTPKSAELVATPYRNDSSLVQARVVFQKGFEQVFTNLRSIAHDAYPLSVYYAFKQEETAQDGRVSTGWETMLEGLIASAFQVTGTLPLRTTKKARSTARNTNALASAIVIVCRPRPDDAPMTSRREFINALRRELPAALREMQTGNIAPVDLAQASIGPGMAVYSRYSKVLEPNGERLSVRTALQLINHELDAYLAEQEGHVDEDSRFAVAWFEQFGFKEGPFGQADVLARAKNTSVDGLTHAGVLRSGAGKVQLYHWSELDPGWDPTTDKRLTVWEAVHQLVERLNSHGEEGAAMLLARMPSDLAAQARQLAYRLYSICERKGWAEHARDYNALVISWSASQEQAQAFREQVQQGELFPGGDR